MLVSMREKDAVLTLLWQELKKRKKYIEDINLFFFLI